MIVNNDILSDDRFFLSLVTPVRERKLSGNCQRRKTLKRQKYLRKKSNNELTPGHRTGEAKEKEEKEEEEKEEEKEEKEEEEEILSVKTRPVNVPVKETSQSTKNP